MGLLRPVWTQESCQGWHAAGELDHADEMSATSGVAPDYQH